MSLLGKAPRCFDGLSAVLLDDEGRVHEEVIGAEKAVSTNGCFVVLYQRGLRPAAEVPRCHRGLISPFKIVVENEAMANVPWANFVWKARKEKGEACRAACTPCKRFKELTAEDVMVVCLHDGGGQRVYQWYVAFEEDKVLTRVPSEYCYGIVQNSSTAGLCQCGRCRHPLYDMINTRNQSRADSFDRRAVAYFTEFHRRVLKAKHEKSCKASACPAPCEALQQFVEDTCSVCLEETSVLSTCVQERCKIGVCSVCISKTRGLCPICDRSKLNTSAGFLCHSCNRVSPLDEYGHSCNGCGKATLCKHCFCNFSMCVHCERDITSSANNKRKRDVDV